jgi:hypothetical protein
MRHILSNVALQPQNNIHRFAVLGIILLAAVLRITLYGDPTLSIAGNDTSTYIESSHVPLFSSEMMTGRRLLTTNLLYKLFEPRDGYQILANGSIATARRVVQPGFTSIVITQLIFSILGWSLLALSISENIKNPIMKIMSAVVIALFAFTPQMADWDSILMSESFTFSLFALQLAILTKLVFSIYKDPNLKISAYLILWAIVYFLWTFLRDTNLFASFVTIGMIVILFFFARYRKSPPLYRVLVFLTVILAVGLITSGNSTRSLIQIINIYNDDLLRSPASVSTLKELGMPAPDSAEYQAWFQENSTKTLIKFMLIHPGYPTVKIIRDFPNAFTEIKQTYFKAPESAQAREPLMILGNALHPENTTSFLLDLLLLVGLLLLAVKNANETSRPWAWLGVWLFLTASITLIPTILGDTWALNRHALFSTMIYRLFMWVFTIVVMDVAIEQNVPKDKLLIT